MDAAKNMSPFELPVISVDYYLPEERIATFPIEKRDQSKLLVYNDKTVKDTRFIKLPEFLKENSLMVFNNTKVVQARLQFVTAQGAVIEIFCLEPYDSGSEINTSMQQQESVRWKCLVGGLKKWKEKFICLEIVNGEISCFLKAELSEKVHDTVVVQFSWSPSLLTFADVLEMAGKVPLPPYIKREPGEDDKNRYQTIYAIHEGSVAAPTAGLHFTPEVFNALNCKNITIENVTLHVGAGTFKPVKTETLGQHIMHSEQIVVEKQFIETLLNCLTSASDIVAVGTTSLRTLESLYWLGIKLQTGSDHAIMVNQWDAYELEPTLTSTQALQSILNYLKSKNLSVLLARTQLLIVPGYQWKFVNALVTNFHQPKSTLILLISAFIGEEWRKIYQHAMDKNYRFLSYGDSSLIFRSEESHP